jgi:hypothetical protein
LSQTTLRTNKRYCWLEKLTPKENGPSVRVLSKLTWPIAQNCFQPGVLTKPDMLGHATQARHKWKSVLQGEEHVTKHGYYAVRLPNDDERTNDITHTELHARGKAFFEETSPWKEMRDRRRFGIANCVNDISALLVKLLEQKFVCSPKTHAD